VSDSFTKGREDAPAGFFAAEAAGLEWLRVAPGGATVVGVRSVEPGRLVLDRVAETRPTRDAAAELGRRLAATHRSGAAHHGCPPAGWSGDGWIATLALPHVVSPRFSSWAPMYAGLRLAPFLRPARDRAAVTADQAARLDRLVDRLATDAGDLAGPDEPASRLHGDLWSGNVLWSPEGAVLVDPAAHGGHRETDLAMLALFGLPHLDEVLAAYDEESPLADGWRERVALHQVHPLLVHAALFGGGYGAQAVRAAARYV
jgi:fructosamine-3-kinase